MRFRTIWYSTRFGPFGGEDLIDLADGHSLSRGGVGCQAGLLGRLPQDGRGRTSLVRDSWCGVRCCPAIIFVMVERGHTPDHAGLVTPIPMCPYTDVPLKAERGDHGNSDGGPAKPGVS